MKPKQRPSDWGGASGLMPAWQGAPRGTHSSNSLPGAQTQLSPGAPPHAGPSGAGAPRWKPSGGSGTRLLPGRVLIAAAAAAITMLVVVLVAVPGTPTNAGVPRTTVEGVSWLRTKGWNSSRGGSSRSGGFALDGTQRGGIPCAPGCEQHGNCNRDDGRCECPFGRMGPACEVVALPACRLAATPDAMMVCPWAPDAWRTVACDCHAQCAQYIQELRDRNELQYPEELQDMSTTNCFNRSGLPPEQQWSDFPAVKEQDVKYLVNGSVEATRPEVAVIEDREQLPLSECPNSCSFAGSCTRAAGNPTEAPACRCLWAYLGPDCSALDQSGTIFEMCPGGCGAGKCMLGFCRCPPGLWGIDCRRSKAWAPQPQRPAERLRVYVYDLPFTLVQMHAARHLHGAAIYQAYLAFFRALLADIGGARTENPYEANLFYIPVQTFQWTDNLGFARWHLYFVTQWVVQNHAFWNASGGTDHMLWWPNDQGAAYSHPFPPGEPTIADYALLDAPVRAMHFCYSGPGAEDGSDDHSLLTKYGNIYSPSWLPGYVFQPTRDVCPAPSHYQDWMPGECEITYGAIPQDDTALRADDTFLPLGNRSTLMYFLGGERKYDMTYSGGARQALFDAHFNQTEGFRISNGSELDPPLRGNPVEERDSIFCFTPSGHGFGMRLIDAMSHGCIPVIVQDEVTQYFEDVLPYTAFSIRVHQCDIPRLDAILRSVPTRQRSFLQWGLLDYHRAFVWPQPYGLAYNYTIASLSRSLANRQSVSALQLHTSWRSWLQRGSGSGNGS